MSVLQRLGRHGGGEKRELLLGGAESTFRTRRWRQTLRRSFYHFFCGIRWHQLDGSQPLGIRATSLPSTKKLRLLNYLALSGSDHCRGPSLGKPDVHTRIPCRSLFAQPELTFLSSSSRFCTLPPVRENAFILISRTSSNGSPRSKGANAALRFNSAIINSLRSAADSVRTPRGLSCHTRLSVFL